MRELWGNPDNLKGRTDISEIMTTSQVAALLQIHTKTVHRWSRNGIIQGTQIGRRWRFRRQDIVALVSGPSRRKSRDQRRPS